MLTRHIKTFGTRSIDRFFEWPRFLTQTTRFSFTTHTKKLLWHRRSYSRFKGGRSWSLLENVYPILVYPAEATNTNGASFISFLQLNAERTVFRYRGNALWCEGFFRPLDTCVEIAIMMQKAETHPPSCFLFAYAKNTHTHQQGKVWYVGRTLTLRLKALSTSSKHAVHCTSCSVALHAVFTAPFPLHFKGSIAGEATDPLKRPGRSQLTKPDRNPRVA